MQYRQPPEELAKLVNVTPDPIILFGPHEHWLAVADRASYPSIDLLRQPELKLAGARINPKTFTPHAISGFTNLRLRHLITGEEKTITGFPENASLRSLQWSPDGSHLGCCVLAEDGLQLYLIDFATLLARPITGTNINNSLGGSPYSFYGPDRILVKLRLADQGPAPEAPFPGPIVQDTTAGEGATRTYTNLLQSRHDEDLFRYYASGQLHCYTISSGTMVPFAEPGIIADLDDAPNGEYFLLTYVEEPFSYQVPYQRFPDRVILVDKKGQLIRTLAERPVLDNLPAAIGSVMTQARRYQWRSDHPAQLYWTEAQDGGDPRNEAEYRDQLFYLEPPFDGEAQPSLKLPLRYGAVYWCRGDLALSIDWRWKDRRQVFRRWFPDEPQREPEVIFDLNWDDKYNDPGSFLTTILPNDHTVLLTRENGKKLVLSGNGHGEAGQRPFLSLYDLESGEIERVWESQPPYFERALGFRERHPDWFILGRESKQERTNFHLRNLISGEEIAITDFPHPYPQLRDSQFEIVKYEREDGVKLSGELHLPEGFKPGKDQPLPVLMWAYPKEYKDAEAAGQTLVSPYQFTHISPMGPLPWITRNFAVFDDFAMPIIGEGDEEPNETFVEQVQANARAAVKELVERGVADPKRIYVGGHSYGAFMTAHLLAHTDLFAGGIARSGAYNRTLTPFGFQTEERTFWEAPEIYTDLSPFVHAPKIEDPLLLIHGGDDSNSGTYPLQSKRFFAALNSLGKPARLVILPHEDHGYSAKESILHMLWEMDEWMH
ncbi:S9 family peptidase [Lewinellaceae bacterium SD302]|nr:S9 family peptidase [Lewinellaceae bacterium SD302]